MSTHVFRLLVPSVMAVTMAAAPRGHTAPAQQQGVMVTVEGCLTREPESGIGAAGTQYVLVDRRATDTAPDITPVNGPQTPAPSAVAPAPVPARKLYVLRAQGPDVNLDAHLNQVVRVTGASTAPQTAASPAARPADATPTLAVTTLSVVAERCR